jgi:hypothetical protein
VPVTTVSIFNVPERTSAQFAILFESPGWEKVRLLTMGKPQVGVVDLDSSDPDRVWKEYRKRYPEVPSVILSTRPQEREGALWLTKPVSPAALKSAIARARKGFAPAPQPAHTVVSRPREDVATRAATTALDAEIEDRCCGDAPDIDPRNADDVARATYCIQGHFQALLSHCCALVIRDGKSRAIEGLPGPFVVHRNGIETTIRPNVLRSVCLIALREDIVHLRELVGTAPAPATPLQPLAPVLWQVALWSARGRLSRDIALDVPVRIRHWPVFTRWTETPNAMRITALLVGAPHTPLDAALALGVPHRHLFPLLSAAQAVGLLESLPGHASTPRIREERRSGGDRRGETGAREGERRESTDRRGILRRILGRLAGH